MNGTNEELLRDVVVEIASAGGSAVQVVGSVADDDLAAELVQTCVDSFGGIDAVVNNAGIVRDRTLMNMRPEEFDEVVAVNLRGTWSVSRHAARAMKETGGLLLQVVSNAAFVGSVGQTNYAASKAGVMGMLYAWDVELRASASARNALVADRPDRHDPGRVRQRGQARPTPASLRPLRTSWASARPRLSPRSSCTCAATAAAHLRSQLITFNGSKLGLWSHPHEAVLDRRSGWTVTSSRRPSTGRPSRCTSCSTDEGALAADPMPTADVVIDAALVRRLLAEQHPELARLPLTDPVVGWDNVDVPARPRPRGATAAPPGVRAACRERTALAAQLAPLLPLPIPSPDPCRSARRRLSLVVERVQVACRRAGRARVPRPTLTRRPKRSACSCVPCTSPRPWTPAGEPVPWRSARRTRRRDAGAGRTARGRARRRRRPGALVRGAHSAGVDGPPLWLHGDLHPANVLVHEGRISAVIDFGDITSGDPATDLSVVWMMFDHGPR